MNNKTLWSSQSDPERLSTWADEEWQHRSKKRNGGGDDFRERGRQRWTEGGAFKLLRLSGLCPCRAASGGAAITQPPPDRAPTPDKGMRG